MELGWCGRGAGVGFHLEVCIFLGKVLSLVSNRVKRGKGERCEDREGMNEAGKQRGSQAALYVQGDRVLCALDPGGQTAIGSRDNTRHKTSITLQSGNQVL